MEEARGYSVLVEDEWVHFPTAKFVMREPQRVMDFLAGFSAGGGRPSHLAINDGTKHLAIYAADRVREVRLMTDGERTYYMEMETAANVNEEDGR